jgi:hypothetical protein
MIVLGTYEDHTLVVNRSNVEPSLVTYQLFKDGKNVCMAREECIVSDEGYPEDRLFAEAEKLYNALGRPELEEWDGSKLRELGIWTEQIEEQQI